ncbi:helix-turn-helix transcriptional regulator [Desulfosporosinus youngiae]|uniref:Putative transcriptional regulator n=1 Tax=Desulfosporosinus youngiae DSM 17734 TaxID=768710 RepID=H5Y0C3_9FIRM|nr:helix-turn-helix transcriptional regulator [Desulfosporosinus youngiae]EHQ92102.1 putative transcriptional regulator [Desulfosporosinus youngiae DSM 17734]
MQKRRNFFSACRKKKGKQKEVAKDLGISEVYVRMIENGTFNPGRDLMFKMSRYFDEPIEILFPDLYGSREKH